jgi:hypothetical protein
VRPLAAGVEHGREPAPGGPPAGEQQLAGVGELVHGAHPQHPVGVEQRLPGAVLAGQGAGVGGDHGRRPAAAPDLEGHHRQVARCRPRQRGPQGGRVAGGLGGQRHRLVEGRPAA